MQLCKIWLWLYLAPSVSIRVRKVWNRSHWMKLWALVGDILSDCSLHVATEAIYARRFSWHYYLIFQLKLSAPLAHYIFSLGEVANFESELVNRIDRKLFNVGVSKSITPLQEYQYQCVCPMSSLAYFRHVIYCSFWGNSTNPKIFLVNVYISIKTVSYFVEPSKQFKQEFLSFFLSSFQWHDVHMILFPWKIWEILKVAWSTRLATTDSMQECQNQSLRCENVKIKMFAKVTPAVSTAMPSYSWRSG